MGTYLSTPSPAPKRTCPSAETERAALDLEGGQMGGCQWPTLTPAMEQQQGSGLSTHPSRGSSVWSIDRRSEPPTPAPWLSWL